MNISIEQACELWEKFIDSASGNASHGEVTEIYAHTLMASHPGIDIHSDKWSDEYRKVAKSLFDMCELFIEKHEGCQIIIDDRDYKIWFNYIGSNFRHRVHVEVLLEGRQNENILKAFMQGFRCGLEMTSKNSELTKASRLFEALKVLSNSKDDEEIEIESGNEEINVMKIYSDEKKAERDARTE